MKRKLALIGSALLALGACVNTGNKAADAVADAVITVAPSIVLHSVF